LDIFEEVALTKLKIGLFRGYDKLQTKLKLKEIGGKILVSKTVMRTNSHLPRPIDTIKKSDKKVFRGVLCYTSYSIVVEINCRLFTSLFHF